MDNLNSCLDSNDEFKPDPELEKLREDGLMKENVDYLELAKLLPTDLARVHASYLFHPQQGWEILKHICICISSTGDDLYINSWRDVAAHMGLTLSQIECVKNSNCGDYTELVLRAFCQRSDASLALVVDVFKEKGRYDALSIAIKHFPGLVEFAIQEHSGQNNIENSGELLKPLGYEGLFEKLPITLLNKVKCQSTDILAENSSELIKTIEHNNLLERIEILQPCLTEQQARPRLNQNTDQQQRTKKSKRRKRVLLTFAKDGAETAKLVALECKKFGMQINFLGKYVENLCTNAEHFIIHHFAQMDYVIPIVTKDYLWYLCNPVPVTGTHIVEERYIKLIHDLMSKYYCRNSCRNDRMRSVVPRKFQDFVINHQHFALDPILQAHFSDDPSKMELFIKNMAKV